MSAKGRPERELFPLGGTARSAEGAQFGTPTVGADAVASPCISVCVMLPEAGVCAGCFRTLDEIAAWSTLDVAGRRAVLAVLPGRRARWEPLARGVRPAMPADPERNR